MRPGLVSSLVSDRHYLSAYVTAEISLHLTLVETARPPVRLACGCRNCFSFWQEREGRAFDFLPRCILLTNTKAEYYGK